MNTPSSKSYDLTHYEEKQKFNALVAWLHSFRYKNVVEVVDELSKLNQLRPIRILDVGCATATLFDVLNRRLDIEYIGIELREDFVEVAQTRHGENSNFQIIRDSATDREVLDSVGQPDVIIALETLEHIPERDAVRFVEYVSEINPRLFVSSVPVEVGPAIWFKNIGSSLAGYVRHNEYSWRETFWAGLYCLDKLPPHGTTHKGFDWRWLAQTIRHNMKIREIRTFPSRLLPTALSTTVFIVAEPR